MRFERVDQKTWRIAAVSLSVAALAFAGLGGAAADPAAPTPIGQVQDWIDSNSAPVATENDICDAPRSLPASNSAQDVIAALQSDLAQSKNRKIVDVFLVGEQIQVETAICRAPDIKTLVGATEPKPEPVEPLAAGVVEVEAAEPTVHDGAGADNSYAVPQQEGITYLVNGKITPAGTYKFPRIRQGRQYVLVSAWANDPKKTALKGVSSWVLRAKAGNPPQPPTVSWQRRSQITQLAKGSQIANAATFGDRKNAGMWQISPDGYLYHHATRGEARFDTHRRYGSGWGGYQLISGDIDFTGDKRIDLIAMDGQGTLWLYPGTTGTNLGARKKIGVSWNRYRLLHVYKESAEAAPRVIAIGKDGKLYTYFTSGTGYFTTGTPPPPRGSGWGGVRTLAVSQDWTGDDKPDYVATTFTGYLVRYQGSDTGPAGTGMIAGGGWGQMTHVYAPAADDGRQVWAQDTLGRLWLYQAKITNDTEHGGHHPANKFKQNGYTFKDPVHFFRRIAPRPLDDPNFPVDKSGALMVRVPSLSSSNDLFHPVAYHQYALGMVESSLVSTNPEYLRRAKATMQKSLRGALNKDDGLWFPYPFDYRCYGDPDLLLRKPWFSGMAQGEGLAAATRLEEVTGDIYWRQVADRIVLTFLALPGDGLPAFNDVDINGNLWFEEYVGAPGGKHVVNGHFFATFGLEYYYIRTHNAETERLFDGATTTAVNTFINYRLPGKPSLYCADIYCWRRTYNDAAYHPIVKLQLKSIFATTGAPVFDEMFTALTKDR